MGRQSAGILLYRHRHGGAGESGLELLLVHPGGPFWVHKDEGAWSIPKGEYEASEDPEACARREFCEETGLTLAGPSLPLGEISQAGGKRVTAFAVCGEFDPAALRSNRFEMEWPPKNGQRQSFPEVDRAAWFPPALARRKINAGQIPFIDRLTAALTASKA